MCDVHRLGEARRLLVDVIICVCEGQRLLAAGDALRGVDYMTRANMCAEDMLMHCDEVLALRAATTFSVAEAVGVPPPEP